MARKKHHEDHVNHEAWAIPYGDLVTLLLAFFVVMYALSSVNEGKYRILSDSLIAAFRSSPKSLEPIQVGQLSRAFHNVQTEQPRVLVPLEIESLYANDVGRGGGDANWSRMRAAGLSPEELAEAEAVIGDIMAAMKDALGELVDADLVRLRQNRYWLEIEINTSVLFPTASAELSSEATAIVTRLGSLLAGTPTRVQVEGHTDVLPIHTEHYPSNWELSAARAATVVRLFAAAGVEPAEMAAVGFGEFQPAAGNDTAEDRAYNRRVVVVVMAGRNSSRDVAGRTELDDLTSQAFSE